MLTYLLNRVKLSNSVGNYICYVDGRLPLMFLLTSAESNTSAFHPRICRCSCCWGSTCLVLNILIEQIMSIGIIFLFSVLMWYHTNMETDSFIVKESTMWICWKSLVVWCQDRRLTFLLFQVWDRRCFNARAAGILTGHLEGITFLDSRGDGRYFISNGKDQTTKLWDIRKMSSNSTRYVLFSFLIFVLMILLPDDDLWQSSSLLWFFYGFMVKCMETSKTTSTSFSSYV